MTTKRLVFVGRLRTHEILLSDLVGFQYNVTQLVVHSRKRQKAFHFETPRGSAILMGTRLDKLLNAGDSEWIVAEVQSMRALMPIRPNEPVYLTDEEADQTLAMLPPNHLEAKGRGNRLHPPR